MTEAAAHRPSRLTALGPWAIWPGSGRPLLADEERALVAGAVLGVLAMVLSALPLYLGFLAPLWDPQRRTWHDRLTGTRVVYAGEHRLRGPIEFLRTLDTPATRDL